MTRAAFTLATSMALVGLVAAPAAQRAEMSSTFRVFLRTGDALPSFGEAAIVGDRVVFSLLVGGEDHVRRRYQLLDLPADAVDLDRTVAYADAVRGAHYAATRGDADFALLTAGLAEALDGLPGIADPAERLQAALRTRERLVDWSRQSYGYRREDTDALADLFDVVLAELRAAAGQAQLTVELSSRVTRPVPEPLRPRPDTPETVRMALLAASVAEEGVARLSILRAAEAVLAEEPDTDDLQAEVRRRLGEELTADTQYGALAATLMRAADAALARGDVAAVVALGPALGARDLELGGRRPRVVRDLERRLALTAVAARAQRAALDHYARVRPVLLDYERRVRPVFVTLDGLRPIISAVRDIRFTSYDRLRAAAARVASAETLLAGLTPPDDLADIHETLGSAVHLAREAFARRLLAATSGAAAPSRDASSAAAGAELLLGRARSDLVARLFPPKPQ